jgi:WD40 repeat protein
MVRSLETKFTMACVIACVGGAAAGANTTEQAVMQFGEWGTPVNVGAPLNTPFNDGYAVFTRDMLTVYFTSDRPGGLSGDDLWTAQRDTVDSLWQTPVNLTVLNSTAADSLSVLSFYEDTMFFASTRPGGCGLSDLWMSRRVDKEWTTPFNIGCLVNTGANENAPAPLAGKKHHHTPTILYFGSNRPGGVGDFDVYETSSNDPDLSPASFGEGKLVAELSSPRRDTRTWVRKDGLEIFITSDRLGGVGAIDIWTATRASRDDKWGTPVNAGALNSISDDGSPWLTKDGTTMYLFSNRAGGLGSRDIWVSTRPPLEDVEEEEEE